MIRPLHSALWFCLVLVLGGAAGTSPSVAAPAGAPAAPTWSTGPNLAVARFDHTATLLPNGEVLVAGGQASFGRPLRDAALFNPVTNAWSSTCMMAAHASHSATLLPAGKVLVAGGFTTATELFDPASNTWSVAGSLTNPLYLHKATLLGDGKVLTTGDPTRSYEVFDPDTNVWTFYLGPFRASSTSTLLPNGKVLVTGGVNEHNAVLKTTEIYDPVSNSWAPAAPMSTPRRGHTATLLANGKVLVAGGMPSVDPASAPIPSAELYDYRTNGWSPAAGMSLGRAWHTANELGDGTVLVAGGGDPSGSRSGVELYRPATNTWSTMPSMAAPRRFHTATLLKDGRLFVAGGVSGGFSNATASTEILALTGISLTPAVATAPSLEPATTCSEVGPGTAIPMTPTAEARPLSSPALGVHLPSTGRGEGSVPRLAWLIVGVWAAAAVALGVGALIRLSNDHPKS